MIIANTNIYIYIYDCLPGQAGSEAREQGIGHGAHDRGYRIEDLGAKIINLITIYFHLR